MKFLFRWKVTALFVLAIMSIAAGRDEPRDYPRTDPNNPGGERFGADDGDDDFTGYPVDVGEPNDPYFDYMNEYAPYPPVWNGSFVGAGLLVGPLWQYGSEFDERSLALSYGAFVNYSSVFEVLDLQAAFRRFSVSNQHENADLQLDNSQLSLSMLVHPFFIGLISGTKFGYTIGAIYGIGGLSFDWVRIEGSQNEDYRAVGWHIGGGIDIPIDSPQDGNAFWIGLQFRQDHIPGGKAEGFLRHRTISQDALLLRLSYRHNGNLFRTRITGPTSP